MDLEFSTEEKAFRERVRDWLNESVPKERVLDYNEERRAFDLEWQRTQFKGGYAGISWPTEYGGCGFSDLQQLIWYEEYARADAPYIGVCFVGINHGGPTLIARASHEQKAFHLPKILQGDVVWCQGFSEPGAGSDLAALKTRAVIEGDELVVNGQKVWTSYANLADYQELLVRTDPDAQKHRGISWVICDMKTPGITIRPIETMSGGRHFCEVFYDDVRIPLSNVIGEINDGWSVAMSTLSFERGTAFMADQVELARRVERLIDLAKTQIGPDGKRPAIKDDEIASRLAMARAEIAALRAMTYTGISRAARTGSPGPQGSMIRLNFSRIQQKIGKLSLDILGADCLDVSEGELGWQQPYLRGFASTIAGGSAQIQGDIIGERVLGLPRNR